MMIENQNGWRGRLLGAAWGWAGENLQRYGGLGQSIQPNPATARDGPAKDGEVVPRTAAEYAVRWAYRQNKGLYKQLHAWGLVEQPIRTVYNPVPAVVAFYLAHTLAGELTVIPTKRPGSGEQTRVRDAALVAAVGRVQERSNWMAFKRDLVESAAVLSDVFIKAAERVDDEGLVSGVYLQQLPAAHIRRCVTDERGYVQALRIDTPRMESMYGTADREHTLVEVWDDVGVRFYEVEGHQTVEDAKLPAPVGAQTFEELAYDFIPVVWARVATYWWDEVDQINERNRLAWLLGKLNKPLMLVAANAAADERGFPVPAPVLQDQAARPAYEEIGDGAAAVMRLPGQVTAAWSGAPVDFAAMQREMTELQAHIEGSLPEYYVAAKLHATQVAAETMQLLLGQAGHRVMEMRGDLESSLVRAQMMALTLGQAAGLEGFGREEIGAYDAGDFGHAFAERPVFTTPPALMAMQLKELVAAGVPLKLALQMAGYDQAVIDNYDAAAAEQAQQERTTLAASLQRQRALVDSGAADNGMTRGGVETEALPSEEGITANQVLNGAQIRSALEIIGAFNEGEFPRENALIMMQTFFNIPRDVAETIVPRTASPKQPLP